MFQIYSLLYSIAFVALLPYFAYQAIANRKYLSNFRERLGLLPETLKADRRPAIWLHAVSVGETLAAWPLIKGLRERFPGHRLIVSTTTVTGQAIARSRITEADGFCYFPFDWRFSVRRSLKRIDPQIVVLMESELWLNFLDECGSRGIPVLLANGRISDRSFARSQRFGFFVRSLYGRVTRLAMQSRADADRAIALGAPPDRVVVSGNLKYDIGEAKPAARAEEAAVELEAKFELTRAPLIVAGSTCEGEEELVLSAFGQLRRDATAPGVRLLIAPRHPERFDQVARLLDAARINYTRRSAPDRQSTAAEVILLDSIGELATLYARASVVFVGGSLVDKGGHNILEPALYARPIVVGPHMENFREIADRFLCRDALVQLRGETSRELIDGLSDALKYLLSDHDRARQLGANARATVEDNRGAALRTVEIISGLINRPDQDAVAQT